MFAGRDTTSTSLTWLFWLITKWRFFNVEESRKLRYFHGALCESLRLFPPVALEHKAPIRANILPSRHYLGENVKLIFSFYSVGRMESMWGKDCLE
ncbi:hypothetical protein ACS0TY_018679 [Phlomoides rotata]